MEKTQFNNIINNKIGFNVIYADDLTEVYDSLENYIQDCKNNFEDVEDWTDEDFYNAYEDEKEIQLDYIQDQLMDNTYMVYGQVGRWDGNKEILPEEYELEYFIQKIDYEDNLTIWEDSKGNLIIIGVHHDGRDYFYLERKED